jgi:hypothetical protein
MSRDPLDLELATTAILADTHDVRGLLEMLARQLSSTLGDKVTVEREGGLLRKSKEIKALRVAFGAKTFVAEVAKGSVTTAIAYESGGIRIRTDKVVMDNWLAGLLAELQGAASSNQASRMALEQIVNGGQPTGGLP